jgi:hypothetical protein
MIIHGKYFMNNAEFKCINKNLAKRVASIRTLKVFKATSHALLRAVPKRAVGSAPWMRRSFVAIG